MIVDLLFLAIGAGLACAWSWWRTRSVVPAVIATVLLQGPTCRLGYLPPFLWFLQAGVILLWTMLIAWEMNSGVASRGRGGWSPRSGWWVVVIVLAGIASWCAFGTLEVAIICGLVAVGELLSRLAAPASGRRPVGGWTILNSFCGYAAFASACLTMPLFAPFALVLPGGRARWIARAMRWPMRGVFAATPTVSWRLQGDTGALTCARLVASNHEGMLDILGACALPGTRTLLAKTWVFRAFPLGLAARAAGLRNSDILDAEDYQAGAETTIGDDLGIFVFPEGTRSKDGQVGRFRPGAFVLARALGAPVVPVAVAGSRIGICPGSMWIHPTRVISRVLAPMAALPDESVRDHAARCRAAIARERQALLRDLLPTRHLARSRRERFIGLGGATARAIAGEERAGAWRLLLRLAIEDDGDWLIVGCGWSTLMVALRQLAPASRLLAMESDQRRRAVANHAWWRADDLIGERLDASHVVDPVGAIAFAAVDPGLLSAIAARNPSFVIAADPAPWRAALPGHVIVATIAGLTALRAPTTVDAPWPATAIPP